MTRPDPRRAVLFDLDGTLMDTLASIVECGNTVLAEFGVSPRPAADYQAAIGHGTASMFSRLLGEPKHSSRVLLCANRMIARYPSVWPLRARPFAGMTDLVSEMQERGFGCGIVSNREQTIVDAMTRTWFPSVGTSRAVIGAGTCPKKPSPAGCLLAASALGADPTHCILVGDTQADLGAARRANTAFVGVTWGFRTPRELSMAGATALAATPRELRILLLETAAQPSPRISVQTACDTRTE